MSNIVEIKNLAKTFDKGNVKAIDNLNLTIKEGEFISIIGPSGSGKSTLLNMIGALDKPSSGYINVAGHDLTEKKDQCEFRAQEIGFIFQLHNLIPNITIKENIEVPMYEIKMSNKERNKKSEELLKYVKLEDKINRTPPELSGGERQRVAIARALANDPSIILADEPTGSLDSDTSDRILNWLKELHNEKNVTLILVTHDMKVAEMANRTIELSDGKVKN